MLDLACMVAFPVEVRGQEGTIRIRVWPVQTRARIPTFPSADRRPRTSVSIAEHAEVFGIRRGLCLSPSSVLKLLQFLVAIRVPHPSFSVISEEGSRMLHHASQLYRFCLLSLSVFHH
ncbi:hypothetical protein BD309DRAFT_962577 [Dichomitus squalens]|uniref:Uncharacterized protein n=1 Tax=Dichomitus squalens TaxID=114155 RepID=A0A4Q9NMN6_9APHY|nr:hypothetical protein BD309DRAFT_962577 [Dichomitus squalens]TBU52918.1 hypothetical protein BD310DRAFT_939184 [Dichomitus squalens]